MILEPTLEGDTNQLRIIGVIEDFHHSSLRDPVGPYMIRYKDGRYGLVGYTLLSGWVWPGKGFP